MHTPSPVLYNHIQHFKELLSSRTKVVCLVHVSNMLGAVLDTDYVVEEAHKVSGWLAVFAEVWAFLIDMFAQWGEGGMRWSSRP